MYDSSDTEYGSFLRRFWKEFSLLVLALIFPTSVYLFCIRAPVAFPTGTITAIVRGMTLKQIAEQLKTEGVVRSALFLELYIHILGGSTGVIAGGYALPEPENVFSIGKRIVAGDHQLQTLRITVPEGSTIHDIATILGKSLVAFPEGLFVAEAQQKEGYLFPDTYFLLPTATPEEIIKTMGDTFSQKIATLEKEIKKSNRPLKDIVTMASIIEKEAHTSDDRRIISGILWERLKIGMPLQVDATFLYINGKNTYDLSVDDLAIDSPYNTYKYAGLPIGPIGNPGLDSLEAALAPMTSPYLYYLSDKSGKTYYARTFNEHKRNREKYMQE